MLKITKKQLITTLLNTEMISENDLMSSIIVNPHDVELHYEIREVSTGITAPQVIKLHEEDIAVWGIEVENEGKSRIIT